MGSTLQDSNKPIDLKRNDDGGINGQTNQQCFHKMININMVEIILQGKLS